MRKPAPRTWIFAILAVFAITGILLTTAVAQKASVPRVQDCLTMGEADVRHLLLLIKSDTSGMVTKQEYMKFMEAEFERLDKEKKGELDVRSLTQSTLSASHSVGK